MGKIAMKTKNETLCADLTLLIGFLLSSADGLYDEPHGYGPFRLLDAARRVLSIIKNNNLATAFHINLFDQIETEIISVKSDEETRAFINSLILNYTNEVKNNMVNE
jgi:hypothetical protein